MGARMKVITSRSPGSHLRMMLLVLLLSRFGSAANAAKQQASSSKLQDLDYRVYPLRSQEEAAVIEWGHSAIISALDASIALFGPQTTQAALLEVETMPVLADPINADFQDESAEKIRKLNNAEEVHGNVVVMTNNAENLTGVDLALIAQKSGAAALLVVNVNDDRPDDIYRLEIPPDQVEEAASIDIPVAVISLSSANVLTTATVTADTKKEDIVNNGMPDRIRLYAGGDRPFFEDVEASAPTIYVIHNLLTESECESLVGKAKSRVSLVTGNDPLQLTLDAEKFVNTERVMLWQGMLQGPERKAIEERIEQVTGFPAAHYSDFIVDKLTSKSYWQPHYDTLAGGYVPLATITVFLSDPPKSGGEIAYPSTSGDPIKIRPVKGMAVVHHNTDENHRFEANSIHALLPIQGDEPFYVARKFILPLPVSKARRIVLPVAALLTGGKLPGFLVALHSKMVEQFGIENGDAYFDKLCVFFPVLIFLLLAQFIAQSVHKQMKGPTKRKSASSSSSKEPTAKKRKNKKRD